MIWKGGPKTQRLAIDALLSGAIPRPSNLPEQVAAFLDRQQKPTVGPSGGASE